MIKKLSMLYPVLPTIFIYDLYDAGAFEGTTEEWLLP
jgi:hypothetical protein